MLNENFVPLWRQTNRAGSAAQCRCASIESGVRLHGGRQECLIAAIAARPIRIAPGLGIGLYIYSSSEARRENFSRQSDPMAALSSDNLSEGVFLKLEITVVEPLARGCASIEAQVRLYRGIRPEGEFSGLRDLPLWRHTIEGEIPEDPSYCSRKPEGRLR